MYDIIDPSELGLPPRTIIEKIDEETLAIVILRKSRIIMSDGMKITKKVESIRDKKPGMNVVLKVPNAPICSKTLQYLEGVDIHIIKE